VAEDNTGQMSTDGSGLPETNPDITAPGTPARGEAMETELPLDESLLDSPSTPQENADKIKTSRLQSTGITSLVVNMNLAKETVGSGAGNAGTSRANSDDDCAFRSSRSGDPTQLQKQRACIHAGTNTGEPVTAEKSAEKNIMVVACAGNPTGTGAGTSTGTGAATGTGTDREKRAKSFEFPPAYYNVRKQRANASSYVELPTVEGNRRKSVTTTNTTWF
jgi:hypothetical protein